MMDIDQGLTIAITLIIALAAGLFFFMVAPEVLGTWFNTFM